MEAVMIIRHSLNILRQLSEVEELIQKVESMIYQNEIKMDKEKLLKDLVKIREVESTSRKKKTN
jgi:regulator of replication initiation timing